MPKNSGKKSNVAIWKIDTTLERFDQMSTEEVVAAVRDAYTKRALEDIRLGSDTRDGKKMQAVWAMRASSGLRGFLDPLLPEDMDDDEKNEIFSGVNKDAILFIYDDDDVFAITGGSGYSVIQNFVDERFPFDLAKRLLRGDFKSADVRDLTGLVYSQSRNFRRAYNFSKSEAFGKVWKKLTGRVDPDIVKNSPHINDFIVDKGKATKQLSADVKSSFTFRKTVNIDDIFSAIKEIQDLLDTPPTEEQQRAFGFLDTLKEVTRKETKDALKRALMDELLASMRSSPDPVSDFDFCHSREMNRFLHGTQYVISDELKWDDTPTASDVLKGLLESEGLVDMGDEEKFAKGFLKLKMSFLDEDDGNDYSDDLWRYFHGEIEHGGKKYFLIDGKWYEVVGEFLKTLSENFIEDAFGSRSFMTTDIPFVAWEKGKSEGEFNRIQAAKDGFYFGDEVFLYSEGKGKVELFDLLYAKDGVLYIIQTKDGFGAATRDACSQIQMAAEIIEADLRTEERAELKRYFKEFAKENPGMSEDQFIDLFDKSQRRYVLAPGTSRDFTKDSFERKLFKSDIAKFEVLGLYHESRVRDLTFLVAHVRKTKAAEPGSAAAE